MGGTKRSSDSNLILAPLGEDLYFFPTLATFRHRGLVFFKCPTSPTPLSPVRP